MSNPFAEMLEGFNNDAPGGQPTTPTPAPVPVQEHVPEPPPVEIDQDDVEARRNAELLNAQPKSPEPEVPAEFASMIAERDPSFGDVGEDEYEAAEQVEPDVSPDPFSARAPEPDLVGKPSPPTPNISEPGTEGQYTPATDSDEVGLDWLDVPMPREEEDGDLPPMSMEMPAGFEDEGRDRSDLIREKASGLMEKPKELWEKYPRPIMFGGIGLVVALVMVIVFGGGTPASQTPPPPPQAELPTVVGEDELGQMVTLNPTKVSANCGAGQTNPALAFNGNSADAWVCPRANGIDGAVLNIMFERTVQVHSVTITPGWNYVAPNGKDRWNEHRVVTKILWRAGGKQFPHTISPTRAGSTFTFQPPKGVATTVMSLTVQTTERPDAAGVESVESGGGLLPPMGPMGAQSDDVDKTFAISSIIITGVELG